MPQKPSHTAAPHLDAPPLGAWPLDALRRAIEPDLPGFICEVLPTVDSTNSELMRRFKAGQLAPTLLVAEQQNAGRGRLGRNWASAPGSSLTFSLGVLLQPQAWDGLSLAVGLSVATSLHTDIQLKWPNDLWVQDCKLAGILGPSGS